MHDYRRLDREHHLHPFTNHRQLSAQGTRVVTRADGVWLWDSDGNQILDAMAGLWCVNIGYGRDELAEIAAKQMRELAYYNCFFSSATPPVIELSERLSSVAPEGFNNVFFCNSGSEANDTVIRLVRHYWAIQGQPQRQTIISRWNAYHGSSVGSASLGGMKAMHKQGGLPIAGVEHIEQPYFYHHAQEGESPEDFGRRSAGWLRERIEAIGPEQVAAFIGEPVQGAGGVITPPPGYWQEIQAICREYGILLIADEVICGFGRTGQWFGSETFGIEPDLMPIAKGLSSGYLPIGGLMVHDRVAQVLKDDDSEFYHGYTYSGHPAACAVALGNLAIIEREGLVERVRTDIGPYVQQHLQALSAHPLVGEVRGVGLLGAIELVEDKATAKRFDEDRNVGVICREHCIQNNLMMRAVGDSMILSPPLVLSHDEADELFARVRSALDATALQLTA